MGALLAFQLRDLDSGEVWAVVIRASQLNVGLKGRVSFGRLLFSSSWVIR